MDRKVYMSICVNKYDPEKRQCQKWEATVNGTPHNMDAGTASAYVVAVKVALKFCAVVNHDIYLYELPRTIFQSTPNCNSVFIMKQHTVVKKEC